MLHHRFPSWLRFGTVAACVSAPICLTATQAPAEGLAPILQRPADASVLKRMPASRDLMTFRGENSSAAWPVFLNRNEAAQITTLQLGLLNTVSALPEGSVLKVAINGRPLSSLPIKSPDRMTPVAVKIPTGVLVPGFNAVQVDVTMTHRVDCSVKATFELWTSLDPAQTGFVLPRQMQAAGKSLDDLAGEPLAAEGTTRIHVRLAGDPDPVLLSRAGDLVGALAARAHLLRPVVDVGPEPGNGPGFDIVMDGSDAAADRRVGQEAGLTLERDPASNRLTVVANATDETGFSATIEALRRSSDRPAEGSAQGLQALATQSAGVAVDDRSISFADLGIHSVTFTGRHLTRTLGVTLPRDFYPSNYGMARLYIDGARAEGLAPSSALVFRVNGALVSSLPLGAGSPDHFDHALLNLPLKFFRPGYNAIEIEGTTPTASDEQCTVSSASTQPRLTIADTSELVMPHLARMQTAPQIAAMLENDREQDGDRDIYLTSGDPAAAGVGLTLVANMATQDGAGRIRFNLDQPVASDKPGIVIGASASLPEMLARPLRSEFKRADVTDDSTVGEPAGSLGRGKTQVSTPLEALHATAMGGSAWLRRNGFFFSGLEDNHVILPVHDDSLLLADVTTQDDSRRIAGIELPRFSDRQDRWLVVTGSSTDAIASANAALIANNHWRDLAGEAVAYDPKADGLKRVEPTQLSYVIPRTVALTDVQPILGGIVSSNILLSVSVLMVLLCLLGLSTHTLLNILGKRSR
ncbi:cellulose biosynthesis cyclic di-GMP-binding regulatory protein BcsB [Lichenifustis flavocetrariae]|uniref:Cyclic di-GMP-binding protein n=1 Tax=Lichenifustis flavocetrariae TaxID=2949735 RepID=A0AA41YTP2_9HYPH|nr:cellulose biosynthesis cyclic di-GMP-binding regulatory protein BcsB [Lichenifustis flavocetrariae]MCW6508391.1 cellulose biosynthesis cyclic di-GMP-binding regulatory protein BcsB [Lichenifustis flavocetrariae]